MKIEKHLFGREVSADKLARMNELAKKSDRAMNSRILAREGYPSLDRARFGDDPLGDPLDALAKDPARGSETLLKLGYLGLWPEANGVSTKEFTIVVLEDRTWLAVGPLGVTYDRARLTETLRKILKRLARGPATKEELIHAVWSHSYDSLRHDPLVYSAIATLRRILGTRALWITTLENGWELAAQLRDLGTWTGVRASSIARHEVNAAPAIDLNWRQERYMRGVTDESAVKAGDYRKAFSICHMTAWRDLDDLVRREYLLRVGVGRDITYLSMGSE